MGSYVLEVAALGVMCALFVGAPAGALQQAATPTVAVPKTPAAPGEMVTVRLSGWPSGTVTVGVCGNEARRGSQDCALVGDVAIAVRRSGTTPVDLIVVAPPVPCPCVVRATAPETDVTATARITLLGVPTGPALAPSGPVATDQLDVQGRVETGSSFAGALARSLAGPSSKTLVLTLHNRGRTPITGLRVVSEVGRDATSGSPLTASSIAAVAPGAQMTVRIPVTIAAPAFGEYRVSGTVYGLETPAQFDVTTSNDPWLLELMVPVTLLAVAQYLRHRERERAADDDPETTTDTSMDTVPRRSRARAHARELTSA